MSTPASPSTHRGPARSGIPLGRLAGIPVRADWSVAFVAAFLTLVLSSAIVPSADDRLPAWAAGLVGLLGAAAFLGSILVHEVAHALVARRHGLRVEAISLSLFGGLAHLVDEPRTPRQAWRVAAAGPAASLGLGVACGVVGVTASALGGPALVVTMAAWLGWANVVLGVFNLLPGLPLDGRPASSRRGAGTARATRCGPPSPPPPPAASSACRHRLRRARAGRRRGWRRHLDDDHRLAPAGLRPGRGHGGHRQALAGGHPPARRHELARGHRARLPDGRHVPRRVRERARAGRLPHPDVRRPGWPAWCRCPTSWHCRRPAGPRPGSPTSLSRPTGSPGPSPTNCSSTC